MSADAMEAPAGEVLLDGRVMRMDGQFSGTYAAGQIVRGQSLADGPRAFVGPPVADVFWFETFMERLMRDVERRESAAS